MTMVQSEVEREGIAACKIITEVKDEVRRLSFLVGISEHIN